MNPNNRKRGRAAWEAKTPEEQERWREMGRVNGKRGAAEFSRRARTGSSFSWKQDRDLEAMWERLAPPPKPPRLNHALPKGGKR